MKSIALTGATSMLGVALINECIKRGTSVLAFARRGSKNMGRVPRSPLVSLVECDLEELGSFSGEAEAGVECFFHVGWAFTDKDGRNSCQKQARNIECALDAVHLAKRLGCKKFVGTGSQAEYGIATTALNAALPCWPITAYGVSKLAAGRLCALECRTLGLEFNWVRILSIYGENDSDESAIKCLMRSCHEGQSMKLGPCTHVWDYLYADDAGEALYLIADKGGTGKVYPLGSGNGRPLKEYVREICEVIDPSYQPEYGAFGYGKDSIVHLEADITELTADTGWMPHTQFKEGIRIMADKMFGGGIMR